MVKQALACLLVVCCFCSAASASTVVWPDTTDLVYFYSPACDLCDDAALLLSNLESESNITILRYDLTEVESLALIKTLLEEKNLEPKHLPGGRGQRKRLVTPFLACSRGLRPRVLFKATSGLWCLPTAQALCLTGYCH